MLKFGIQNFICLNKNIPTLEISNDKKSTNIDELNAFLDKSNINSIEVWLLELLMKIIKEIFI